MMLERPTLYFRRKENGAVIYRVGAEEHARLDLQKIAILKHNGGVKPLGKHQVTENKQIEIGAWHDTRKAGQITRDAERVNQFVGDMNTVAQWVQANANDTQIGEFAQPILMAMHDLRSTLVRRMAGRGK